MIWRPLSETLLQIVEAVRAPEGCGITVTEAYVELPLEVQSGVKDGELVFYGIAPHSRWKAGVLPEVHRGTLKIELAEEADVGG
jgi:hypothetical protein